MLVGRWWVVRVGKLWMEGWQESVARSKAAAADWIAQLKRGATTINGAAEMGRER